MKQIKTWVTDNWGPPLGTTRRDLIDSTLDSFIHAFFRQCLEKPKNVMKHPNRKLQTNEDHHSALLDEIWLKVPSTASFLHFLHKVCKDTTNVVKQLKTWATNKWGPPFDTTRRDLIGGTIESLMYAFLGKVYKVQKTLRNRVTSKLQTNEDHHLTLLDDYSTRSD